MGRKPSSKESGQKNTTYRSTGLASTSVAPSKLPDGTANAIVAKLGSPEVGPRPLVVGSMSCFSAPEFIWPSVFSPLPNMLGTIADCPSVEFVVVSAPQH